MQCEAHGGPVFAVRWSMYVCIYTSYVVGVLHACIVTYELSWKGGGGGASQNTSKSF